jgi:hypothetical protein
MRVRLRPGGEVRGGRIFVPSERAALISRSSGIRLAPSCDLLRGGWGNRASRRRRRRALASAPRAPQRRSPDRPNRPAAPGREEITLSARRLFGTRFFTSDLPKDFGLRSVFRHLPAADRMAPQKSGCPVWSFKTFLEEAQTRSCIALAPAMLAQWAQQ